MQDLIHVFLKTFIHLFFYFVYPRFIIKTMWQTVNKYHIYCVLLCSVNYIEQKVTLNHNLSAVTKRHQKPHGLPHSSQKPAAETTASAHPFSTHCNPLTFIQSEWLFILSAWHIIAIIIMCISNINNQMHKQIHWQQPSISACCCQMQYHAQWQNTHRSCMCAVSCHTTAAIVCYCIKNFSNVNRIVAWW